MKYIEMMEKVHVYMFLHIASFESTAGSKTRLFLVRSSFLPAGSAFCPTSSNNLFQFDYTATDELRGEH